MCRFQERLERGDEDCRMEAISTGRRQRSPTTSLKSAKCANPQNKWLLKQDLQPTGTRAQLLRTTENLGKPGAVISIPAAISWQWCKGSLKQRSGWQRHMAQQPGGAWATGRERAMQQVGSEAKNTTGHLWGVRVSEPNSAFISQRLCLC